MKKNLDDRMGKMMWMDIVLFQLRSIDLPDPFENAIQLTEVKKQDILKAQAERSKNLETQGMRKDIANITKYITIANANGAGNSTKINADAVAATT